MIHYEPHMIHSKTNFHAQVNYENVIMQPQACPGETYTVAFAERGWFWFMAHL